MLEFLGDKSVGCRVSSGRARVDEDRDGEESRAHRAQRVGRARPRLYFSLFSFICSFLSYFYLSFCSADQGNGG